MYDLTRRAVLTGVALLPLLPRAGFAQPRCVEAAAAMDRAAEALLRELPESAVYSGVPAALEGGPLARRLDDYSPEGEARLRDTARTAHAALGAVDCPPGAPEALRLAAARAMLAGPLASADIAYGRMHPFHFAGHVPYVVSQISGPHIDAPGQMAAQQSVRSPQEAEAYLAKLADFPRALDGATRKMRADAALGAVPPAVLMRKTLGVIDGFVEPAPEAHVLVTSAARRMREAGLDAGLIERTSERAAGLMRTAVYPAYGRLREAVAELAARGNARDGLWAQPDGARFYAANVAHLGDTELGADAIHKLGLDEVARITAEMDAGLRAQGLSRGSVGARMAELAKRPALTFPDTPAGREAVLAHVRGLVRSAEALYPRFLEPGTIPRQQLEVRPVPAYAQASAPGAYYDGPSLDGSRPGIYWLNLRDMHGVTRIGLSTLTFHEGVPGHHTQSAVALNQGDLPLLIKVTSSLNAYQEGWALYAERLAGELGLYARDPVGDLGRLQDELFRGVRLVVDTGLHHHRWPRERAIQYMAQATGSNATEVEAEIERHMAWPGQALGYKLGQLRLLEMREAARKRMGKRFSLPGFHEVVLKSGPAPLGVIEGAVRAWAGLKA